MNEQDRQAIEGVFARLQEVESKGAPRDPQAEDYIRERVARQPGAAYYLAQTVVVQEQALAAAQRRIGELEQRAGEAGGPLDATGFGRGAGRAAVPPGAPGGLAGAGFGRNAGQGGGFLAGAMQTALGVAGGMMLGSLLGGMFGGNDAQAAPAEAEPQGGEPDPAAPEDAGMDGGDMGGDFGGFDDI